MWSVPTRVCEVRRRGVVFLEDFLKARDVLGEFLGRDGRVLDEGVRLRVALHAHQQRDRGLPELPEPVLRYGCNCLDRVERRSVVHEPGRRPSDRIREVVDDFGIELEHQRCLGPLGDRFGVFCVLRRLGGQTEHLSVHQFDRAGPTFEGLGNGSWRLEQLVVTADDQRGLVGSGHERERGFDDDAEGPSAPTSSFEIYDSISVGIRPNHLLQIVAADAALEFRIPLSISAALSSTSRRTVR